MTSLKLLLFVIIINSTCNSQGKWFYGGINEGDGVFKGFKVNIDFKDQSMLDTLYYASPFIQQYSIDNPNNPKDWIPVFKNINPMPIHLLLHKVSKNSVDFVMEKGKTDWGGWDQYSFSGKLGKDGIKVVLKYSASARDKKVAVCKYTLWLREE